MAIHGIVCLVMAGVAGGATGAGRIVGTPREYLILRPARPVTVDGKLDEWDVAGTGYVLSPESKDPLVSVMPLDPGNQLKGASDLSARAALAWDERCLYVAAQVTDDHLLGVKPTSAGNQGPPGWACDSLMVAIASFRQPMKTNSPYHATPFLGLRYAPAGPTSRGQLVKGKRISLDKRGGYWILTRGSRWAARDTVAGYNVEAAVPWADLGFTARAGERLFVGFLAADLDPGERLNQMGWGYEPSPKDRPVFRLADRSDMLGLVTTSADDVPTGSAWAARVELDARAPGVRLVSVRVKDASGHAVLTSPLGLDVPPGKTGRCLVDVRAGVLAKRGAYAVELVASVGNGAPTVVARAAVRAVKRQPDPPMVVNPPGEIRHAPPDRVWHHACREHRWNMYRHGFVTGKADYVPFIRQYALPRTKEIMRRDIKSRDRTGGLRALYCLALHRITGDDEYVRLARDMMDVHIDLLKTHTGAVVRPLVMYRYLTWMKDPTSVWVPKDAEKRYRASWHYVATHPKASFFTESGTHNRVWGRYVKLKMARLVAEADGQPVDPRVIEYTDFHDKLIGRVGDADDASAHYHWTFLCRAMSVYWHTGDWDAFVKHPGFPKAFARYVEMVSPSGAVPLFGSGSGWHEVDDSLWAYEWFSKLTGDGRYRWTSHRIAEYYYNHVTPRPRQYGGVIGTACKNFVLAYLLADDRVKPTPPSGRSRVTWRHPHVPTTLAQRRSRPGMARAVMDAGRWIPDKLVLSSGNDARDLWGLVDLLPAGGHTGELPGNLIALVMHDAALLAGQGYFELTPSFQNLLWIEDLDGLAADPRPVTTTVPVFADDRAVTFARIRTEAYQHLPVTYTRDVVFVKNGFVVVKDRATFGAAMKVRLGPSIQTRCLGPECGAHWFNTYYDQLYYTGLGRGRGVHAYRNPAWDLLVYFTPRAGRRHTVTDRYAQNPYRCSPTGLRQVWSGMTRPGQTIAFTTVLLPHAPMFHPAELVEPRADPTQPKRVEVAVDRDDLCAIKVVHQPDVLVRRRYETWVMINDTGRSATAGPIETDAVVAVVGHSHKGQVRDRVVVGGTVLRYRGTDQWRAARRLRAVPVVMPKALASWKRP